MTNSLLVFITVSLLLSTVTNFLTLDYTKSDTVRLVTKLGIVLVNNFPFFAIRIYLFTLYGTEVKASRNTLFFLFAVKEFATLLLTVIEVGIQVYQERKKII